MKLMRDDLEDKYGIVEFQNQLLNIMVDIDKFCNKYDIDYCLMAGSALGAERHHGFIPWDDDIDIYMTEEDYCKFRQRFNSCNDLKQKYYLQEWGKTNKKNNTFITMAKVRMNGSMIYEKAYEGWKMHQGLFVDIFILHKTSSSILKQKMQYIWSEAVVLKGLQVRKYKAKSFKEKILLSFIKIIPAKWLLNWGLSKTYKYYKKNVDFYHGFIDTRSFSRAVYKKNVFFPTKYVDFENIKLRVPAQNEEYLKIQFGPEFMIPPPEDKRPINKHTNGWKIDSKIIYEDVSDEKKLI